MAGNTVSQSFSETTFASGYDLAFEQSKFHNLDGNAQNFRIASDYFETALLSYFGRVNYKLMDKYLLTMTRSEERRVGKEC